MRGPGAVLFFFSPHFASAFLRSEPQRPCHSPACCDSTHGCVQDSPTGHHSGARLSINPSLAYYLQSHKPRMLSHAQPCPAMPINRHPGTMTFLNGCVEMSQAQRLGQNVSNTIQPSRTASRMHSTLCYAT
ncbi:hypothetical protein B0H67DRAFT_367932 [Lasiosphaeris hirsuta]|uniref:Secreted protein n=1 Tax=Lasiosphaeris hirsuta TaxID=260670 RepID=A0AA39ZWN8_9PEZI|nr:hypothetical protein B0H67DRAFT_367932 [Lasiosphaeris hirsuta]